MYFAMIFDKSELVKKVTESCRSRYGFSEEYEKFVSEINLKGSSSGGEIVTLSETLRGGSRRGGLVSTSSVRGTLFFKFEAHFEERILVVSILIPLRNDAV